MLVEPNRVYEESCLDTMKRMPDFFIDLTVTSPPYSQMRTYSGSAWSFEIFQDIAKELYRVTKEGGSSLTKSSRVPKPWTASGKRSIFRSVAFECMTIWLTLKRASGTLPRTDITNVGSICSYSAKARLRP